MSDMKVKLLADRFFNALINFQNVECLLDQELVRLGLLWDYWTDWYDSSIEFKAPLGTELTSEQQSGLWEIGFIQCWLNYPDKSQLYYHKEKE